MSGDKNAEAIAAARLVLSKPTVANRYDNAAATAARAVLSLADEVERLRQSVLRLEHELDEAQETIARYVDEETKGGAT